jgi:hypothetical protein
LDTTNHEDYEEEDPWIPLKASKVKKDRKNDDDFRGFTYKRDLDSERTVLALALENLEKTANSMMRKKE